MFDISLFEFFLAAVVALLVLGPNRLPGALRTLGLWVGRLRRSYYNVKSEIEREIGMDDVRRQLHNEQVMADVRRVEREVRGLGTDAVGVAETEPSAGEREGLAPRMEEPSAGEQATPDAAPTAGEAASAPSMGQQTLGNTPDSHPAARPLDAGEQDDVAAAGQTAAATGTEAERRASD